MTNNQILALMVENATADNDDKTLDNALRLSNYVKNHPNDFTADYARNFISAYINKNYVDMMTEISNFAKYLASELKIIEEIN